MHFFACIAVVLLAFYDEEICRVVGRGLLSTAVVGRIV